MKNKKRLDVLLVEQGYADSRAKAQAIIMSGQVYVAGQKADKPGTSFEESAEIEVRGAACPYVSRGGLKLEKAEVFPMDGTEHMVIVLRKVAPTPAKFPRRYAKIKAAPL